MRIIFAALLQALAIGVASKDPQKDVNTFATWPKRGSNDDLLKFVTRPDLTPPKLNATFYSRKDVAPGYIFVAPYSCLGCGKEPLTTYVTQQIGPHIYTQDGDLVWSGVDLYPDKQVFDFRAVVINGLYHLSLICPRDTSWKFPNGTGVLLDASYQSVATFSSPDYKMIDIHEMNVVDSGRSVLIGGIRFYDAKADSPEWSGSLMDGGFVEFDLQSQKQQRVWWAGDNLSLLESSHPPPKKEERAPWDWFHLNSIDKTDDGYYLISARYTNTIYLISPDGSIQWRLGGKYSAFKQDFNFSRQHDARFRGQNATHFIISFFDNAMDDEGFVEPTSSSSSLLVVALERSTMIATRINQIRRPDGMHTQARGNMQFLSNGNILGSWGENAYITEHSQLDGEMLYEASFASTRTTNYRAYKMPFVGRPIDKPIVKAFVSTNFHGNITTTVYVSWNGATEVERWNYYSSAREGSNAIHVGSTQKRGFETVFVANGYHPFVLVEAVDKDGNSLANSISTPTELPVGFYDTQPDHDAALLAIKQGGSNPLAMLAVFFAGVVSATFCTRFLRGGRRGFWGLSARYGTGREESRLLPKARESHVRAASSVDIHFSGTAERHRFGSMILQDA